VVLLVRQLAYCPLVVVSLISEIILFAGGTGNSERSANVRTVQMPFSSAGCTNCAECQDNGIMIDWTLIGELDGYEFRSDKVRQATAGYCSPAIGQTRE
jgi:hypothetical protein